MRTSTKTLLSLYEWATVIGLNPFEVAQISRNLPARQNLYPPVESCESTMFQHTYQSFDHLSRNEIGEAIAQAEELFASYVGYFPAPKYFLYEQVDYPLHYNVRANSQSGYFNTGFPTFPLLWGYGSNMPMRTSYDHFRTVQLKYGHVANVGIETLTQISTIATVLSSKVGAAVMDTFTVTAPGLPAGTIASEIALFFVSGDRAGLSLEESEIKPLTVSISGATATITGSITLLVKPTLQEPLDPDRLDATDTSIYAANVIVYRRTTDSTNQGYLLWSNVSPCDSPPCDASFQTSCFQAVDKERGVIAPIPASYDSTLAQFVAQYPTIGYREPDRVQINYLAGYPRQANGRMDTKHARIIALLATALLPNKTSGCVRADQRLSYYRDVPRTENGDPFVTPDMLNNPFRASGRGALEAWSLMQPLIQYSSPRLG